MTIKWNIVSNQSNANFDVRNEVIYDKNILKSNLCDYNEADILVTGDIAAVAAGDGQVNQVPKQVLDCAPYAKCITKIEGTTIDDAEDFELVMLMYLKEYSLNHSDTTGIYGSVLEIKQLILIMMLQTLMLFNLSNEKLN